MKTSKLNTALLVILIVFVAIGIWVVVTDKNGSYQPSVSPADQTSGMPASSSGTISNQATPSVPGVTFTNANSSYSFSVPLEWKAAINQYNPANALFGPTATSAAGEGGLEVYKNQDSLQEYVVTTQTNTGISWADQTNVTVNGVPGIHATTRGPTGKPVSVVALFKNNTVYSFYYAAPTAADVPLFNSLVQSFKFSN